MRQMFFTCATLVLAALAGCSSGSLSVGHDNQATGTDSGKDSGSDSSLGADSDAGEKQDSQTGLPCCAEGQGWGSIPTANPQTCEGCCAGLTDQTGPVGPGDTENLCVAQLDSGPDTSTGTDADSGDADLPCCGLGEGWGGLPTTNPQVCMGCCPGLSDQTSLVGPGDIANTCVAPDGGSDSGKACVVVASSYAATCSADSDCVGVPLGGDTCNPCTAGSGAFECTLAAVNASAASAYQAALSAGLQKWNGTTTFDQCILSSCPTGQGTRCQQGMCVIVDSLASDAGGD